MKNDAVFLVAGLCAAAAFVFAPVAASAGWTDVLNRVAQRASAEGGAGGGGVAGGLSSSEYSQGLRAALSKGVRAAVSDLGRRDGYFGNAAVKILLPEPLRKLETPLRLAGQGQLLDDLVLAMNRAAEKAVPQAAGILGDAVKNMRASDAKNILTGGEDSATQYFRKSSDAKIGKMMQPIIAKATDSVGVARAYKRLAANPKVASLVGAAGLDLDSYVNARARDGLFAMIAKEERGIRTNPAERTTSILKKVFGGK